MHGFGKPPTGAPAPSAETSKGTPASPEMQQEYNKLVGLALMAMSSEDFLPKAEKVFQSSPSIENAMAQVGSTLVAKILDSARKQGARISPEVLLHGGFEIMGHIGDLARASGKADVTDEQIETAYYLAADSLNGHLKRSGAINDYQAEDEDQFMQQVGQDAIQNVRGRVDGARNGMMQSLMGGMPQ